MVEKVLGIIENVQSKPPGSWTQKSCDLIFTEERLLCVKVGGSSFVAAMVGSGLSGPSGAIAFSMDSYNEQEYNRDKRTDFDLNDLLAQDEGNYMIWYGSVESGSFKTGFFSTLGMMAPLEIKTVDGDKYFYNIYNNQKEYAKALIEASMPVIKT
ncbi:hypothetical protein MUP51_07960 [Candidatus Bathyarchaeota archaeon]|nr:hypothetical protein [Candidatus Bathyarchaeota archaeon]